MEVKRNTSVTLSANDIEQLIIDGLKKRGYVADNYSVIFDMRSRIEGFGTAEYEVTSFRGARVDIE